jgi:2-amino-4-hydroxy-6-hydroxymethyldihydropteridine diphosphokinase
MALNALGSLPQLTLAQVSRWYETVPDPPSDQPLFVNGVARLSGECDPDVLLRLLHGIERQFGRERSVPNAARVLDLDIIDLNGIVRPAPDPILPHPRAHLRSFVLMPLADVAPGWVHPTLNLPVGALISGLPSPTGVRPL